MPTHLNQADIDELTQLIGSDWQTADRVGFYIKYYEESFPKLQLHDPIRQSLE